MCARISQGPKLRQIEFIFSLVLFALVVGGCSTAKRVHKLDRDARKYIELSRQRALPGQPPEKLDIDHYLEADQEAFPKRLRLDLRQSLALAAKHGRDYQTSKENLYFAAISVWTTAHEWDWNVSNSLAAVLKRDLDGPDTSLSGDVSLGVSRRLLSGGRLSVSLAVDSLRYLTGARGVDIMSLAGVTLSQPLLSGYGPLVARESLTQAERDLVYALRSYVRNRKNLLLGVAEKYYAVLSAMDSMEIAERNDRNLTDSYNRSKLMAEAGRVPPFQVDQARQDQLSAHSTLVSRQQSFQARKDELKQTLGIPLRVVLEVDQKDLKRLAQSRLPTPTMAFEVASQFALDHRLDYATVLDELADAERAVKIALDNIRAKLDLELSGNASSPTDSRFRGIVWDKGDYSAGFSAEFPFDKTSETAAYKRSLITRARKRRALSLKRDQIAANLRSDWRNLKAAEDNYRIQSVSVTLAEKRIESTELLFQAGRVAVRDVLDARNSLIQAKNSLTQALVSHRLSWLRLQYDLERLPTEPETLWSPALELADPGRNEEK